MSSRSGHRVIVGDANGADKAVQKHFHEIHYDKVTVFCSGATASATTSGPWATHKVPSRRIPKGFQFYAAKDREMAHEADFGLMIWDGKSAGTVLNMLRLAVAGKIAVLFNVPDKASINIKSWSRRGGTSSRIAATNCAGDVRERATPDEWQLGQADLLDTPRKGQSEVSAEPPHSELASSLNAALAKGDPAAVIDVLGSIRVMVCWGCTCSMSSLTCS